MGSTSTVYCFTQWCFLLLYCSIAIVKYLATKYPVADHWYPADTKQRARVDEYLAWQHTNTRMNAAAIYRLQVRNSSWMIKFTGNEAFVQHIEMQVFVCTYAIKLHSFLSYMYEVNVKRV